MVNYKTAASEAEAEQTIEKSRFIGYIKPVETREEAESFIAEIRSRHKGATHNVPAYVIGDNAQLQWASDDGEPSGTSGAPVLHMLVGEGLTNVVMVITRYFGGIKLGTGGLVRAYTSTARLALDASGICQVSELDELSFSLDYSLYGRMQNLEQTGLFVIDDAVFTDRVSLRVHTDPENTQQLLTTLSEITGGNCSGDAVLSKKILGKKKI